jgi:hypothetical protein
MTIPYRPFTEEELEKAVEERIEASLSALNEISDATIPEELFKALTGVIENYDWGSRVVEDDYALYEDYVDNYRMYAEDW